MSLRQIINSHIAGLNIDRIIGDMLFDISGSRLGMEDIGAILDSLVVRKIDSIVFVSDEFSCFIRTWDSIDEYRLLTCAFVMVCRKRMIDCGLGSVGENLLEIVVIAGRIIDSDAGEFCFDLLKLLFQSSESTRQNNSDCCADLPKN